jgi:hypothetical protein
MVCTARKVNHRIFIADSKYLNAPRWARKPGAGLLNLHIRGADRTKLT